MIGESTIEAAARRGLAKRRLDEKEPQTGRQREYPSEDDGRSEATTLAPQNENMDVCDSGARDESESELSQPAGGSSSTELELQVFGRETRW
jgi:hypothetical protein